MHVRTARRFWLIVVGCVLIAIVGAALAARGRGFTSRRQPWPLEARLAVGARRLLTPRQAIEARNPLAESPSVIRDGMAHFADHCASCHANDGSGDISLGRSLFPRAPDMRSAGTQARTDGELFYGK
ncbi:MAG: hypothetical protein ABI652_05140 [Acidobacteriota bacterium]